MPDSMLMASHSWIVGDAYRSKRRTRGGDHHALRATTSHARTTNAVASLVAAGSPDATMRPNLAHTATISRSTESHQPAEETQRWQRRRRAAASEALARARRAAAAPSGAPSARRRGRAGRRRAARARGQG